MGSHQLSFQNITSIVYLTLVSCNINNGRIISWTQNRPANFLKHGGQLLKAYWYFLHPFKILIKSHHICDCISIIRENYIKGNI